MNNYHRRVLALEQVEQVMNQEETINEEIRAHWGAIERYAAEVDITPSAFADEVRADARRRAEIGHEAADREYAELLGITVAQLRDPDFMHEWEDQRRRKWEEWQACRAAEQAQLVTWRGGHKYVGNVPQYDENGRPIMFIR